MAKDEHPEFKVTDRRRWTEAGELKDDVEVSPPKPAAPVAPAGPVAPPPLRDPERQEAPPERQEPPPIAPTAPKPATPPGAADKSAEKYSAAGADFEKLNFEKLILSFAQTAMLQLGLIAPDPSQPIEPDLYGARETIDMLGILQEKTRGNLNSDEQRLLDNSLYELRMAWMELERRLSRAR